MMSITIRKNVTTKPDSDLVNEIHVRNTHSSVTIGEDNDSVG